MSTAYLKDTLFNINTGKIDSVSYGKKNIQYYIRLGSLLQFIQDKLIYNIKTSSNNAPMLNFDFDENTNLMFVDNLQISINPDICMINRDLLIGGKTYKFIEDGEKFINDEIRSPSNSLYGKIMNIYINGEWLLSKMEEIKDDKNRSSLIDFLKSILKGINEALGGINSLDVIVDEETNTVKIIDNNPLPDFKSVISYINSKIPTNKINSDIVSFELYGYNSKGEGSAGFIKDFSFKTEISPEFSTMITVGAAANSSVVGENATTLSRLNSGLTDRFKESMNNPVTPIANDDYSKLFSPIPTHPYVEAVGYQQLQFKNNEEFQKVKEQFTNTYIQFLKYLRSISNGEEISQDQTKTYTNTLTNLIQAKQNLHKLALQRAYVDKGLDPSTISQPNTGFLPFNLSITLDGLSGMKIYNKFTVDTSYLPSNYPNTVEFLTKGINHTIQNSKWVTNLESICIPKGIMSNGTGQDLEYLGQSSPRTQSTSTPSKPIPPVAQKVYNFFIQKGFTTFQSAAWVGNLNQESGLDPTIVNSIGAVGIAQWLGSRKTKLTTKPNYKTLDVQLDFIWEELQTTEKNAYIAIKNTTSLEDATIAIRKKYERPGEAEARDDKRLSYASEVLNKFA